MPSYDFIQNPIVPGQYQNPANNMPYQQQQYQYNQYQQMQQQSVTTPVPVQKSSPNITTGGYHFTIKPDDEEDIVPNSPLNLSIPPDPSLIESKHKSSKTKKELPEPIPTTGIIKSSNTDSVVEEVSTISTYGQSTMLLNNTLDQIDMVSSEVKDELDQVRSSRTLKRKYDYVVGLANTLGQLLNAKTQVLREINNAISKSNDLDYRREKDRKEATAAVADDKYVMDLYNAFIKNPNSSSALGPGMIDASLIPQSTPTSGIIRSSVGSPVSNVSGVPGPMNRDDAGYLNYLSKVSPEQNMMFYENDPNVKTVVVFDQATGSKFFQVMNIATGQVIPNVPVLDERFMADTTIDIKNMIAKNNNLRETYPLIIINNDVTKEY